MIRCALLFLIDLLHSSDEICFLFNGRGFSLLVICDKERESLLELFALEEGVLPTSQTHQLLNWFDVVLFDIDVELLSPLPEEAYHCKQHVDLHAIVQVGTHLRQTYRGNVEDSKTKL